MKIIIISMLMVTLLLASCSKQEGNENEESNESSYQEQKEVKEGLAEDGDTPEEEAKEVAEMKRQQLISKSNNNIDSGVEARIIRIDAKKWEYSIKEIRVKKGEKIIIKINNVDFDHGIAIPGMKIVGLDEIVLDTSKIGIFEFRCANYCGSGHSTMEGKIIIE